LSESQTIDDQSIIHIIEALQADGENVTSWAVQSRLGGGDFSRIEQIIEQQLAPTSNDNDRAQHSASGNKAQELANQDIIDKNMPANIESSMSAMQQALGQMASQIWSDAAGTAENKVREKLSSLQAAYDETKAAYSNAQKTNEQMQQTISTLNQDLESLKVEYKHSVEDLAKNESALQTTTAAKDNLEKSVQALEVDNQQLEQTAFDAKLESAKTQGLAETIKEQLFLAKESEKQLKRSLERAESKIDELNIELHNVNKALREESTERQTLEKALKEQTALTEQAQQELLAKPAATQTEARDTKQQPVIEPPQPTSNKAGEQTPAPLESEQAAAPQQEVAQETEQQPVGQASQSSAQQSIQQPIQQPIQQSTQQTLHRIKPSADKTRSLSAKLFDRKKEHPKQRRK
jgi:hypothetical protein